MHHFICHRIPEKILSLARLWNLRLAPRIFQGLMRFSISRKECLISCLRTSVLNIIEHTSTVLTMKMYSAVTIICMPSMTGRVHNIQFKCIISWHEFLRGTKRLEIYSSSYCISVYNLFIHTFFCLASHSGIQI